MPDENHPADTSLDGQSSDDDHNAVEVVFDPANPYRRKSSLVSAEAARPRLRKSMIVPSPNDKAHCIVHHFLEAQRLGGGEGSGSNSSHHTHNQSHNHHHNNNGSARRSHTHHHLGQIQHIAEEEDDDAATTTTKDGELGVFDASDERGLNRRVEPKGSSHSSHSHHADVARLRRDDQAMVVEPVTSDSDAGQVDEREWARDIATGDGVPPHHVKRTASATSIASTDIPEPTDILHSRLLTKKQLSEMAWGVRELSRRLGSIRLRFRVKTIFLLTKIYDEDLLPNARALTKWLLSHERDVRYTVYLERSLGGSKVFDMAGLLDELRQEAAEAGAGVDDLTSRLRFWDEAMCRTRPHMFDFVITLGGDGTVLYASWLFQRIVPPVLSFSLGSLGFLTKFDFDEYEATLTRAFTQGVMVSLRLRFEATIMRSQAAKFS